MHRPIDNVCKVNQKQFEKSLKNFNYLKKLQLTFFQGS